MSYRESSEGNSELKMVASRRKIKGDVRAAIMGGTLPQYLRAEETSELEMVDRVNHYVEWHSGKGSKLAQKMSHAQVCLYGDLGEVCKNC